MMQLECPWCGKRHESEFRFGGEAHLARPADPSSTSDEEWAHYLYYRENTRGVYAERWQHMYGCGQWFNVLRDTTTHEVLKVYPMGASQPANNEHSS